MSTEPTTQLPGEPAVVLKRLVRHIAMMAPHQKCREGGILLVEATAEIGRLREALLLYHEAWNGCEGNWHGAMKRASVNAEAVLWPNYLFRRKDFGLCAYWGRNAELLAVALIMS